MRNAIIYYLFHGLIKVAIILQLIVFTVSCKKFVAVESPIDRLDSKLVFDKDNTAIATLNGMYSDMVNSGRTALNCQTTLRLGLCADELAHYSIYQDYFNNALTATDAGPRNDFWSPVYHVIYTANACIEGANSSTLLTAATKRMVVGEAKVIRAFCHLLLTNIFGPVPLSLTTDYTETSVAGKASIEQIYQVIIQDLTDARDSLSATYPSTERIRPNKHTANALLARAYLYSGKWEQAAAAAGTVISQPVYSVATTPLDKVFLKESEETIWQLKPLRNTYEGSEIVPASVQTAPSFLISAPLLAAFETGDNRKTTWLKTYMYMGQNYTYPYKYKARGIDVNFTQTEYYIMLRLAEQYLIRAECRAKTNQLNEAIDDLNVLRQRAGLADLPYTLSQLEILQAIEQERRIELFAEWGHRWMDLKRTGRINDVLGLLKPTWSPYRQLWPIPLSEIIRNPNLLPQNEGY